MNLIDTSAWLFALKKDFHPVIMERIGQLLVEGDVAICGMIALELLGGTKSEKEYLRLKAGSTPSFISNISNRISYCGIILQSSPLI